jgi:cysteine desulfurase family protein (TIGR01976 family)
VRPDLDLDLDFVRRQFPVFGSEAGDWAMLENAGGSYACAQTIDALSRHYVERKVQPYHPAEPSAAAGRAMDRSLARWAEALGVDVDEVHLGPSTSANTYVLAQAFGELLGPDDEVIVTDQDHEANRGSIERAVRRAGATLRVWHVDPDTGLLDPSDLEDLLDARTRLVHLPHASNVVGVVNDVHRLVRLVHEAAAWAVVDGVSAAPHGIPDVAHLHADVYLFSLYKVFSVHQGAMVVRRPLLDALPNQGHFFNADVVHKKLNPAGPDHPQVAAAGAVLDLVQAEAEHHGDPTDDLRSACAAVGARWQAHERSVVEPLLEWLADRPDVRLLGPVDDAAGHRCPTVAFALAHHDPVAVATALAERRVAVGVGHFYAWRTLQAMGVDPARGVLRASMVHYTSADDVERLLEGLEAELGR